MFMFCSNPKQGILLIQGVALHQTHVYQDGIPSMMIKTGPVA
jgi:hypothetical protein